MVGPAGVFLLAIVSERLCGWPGKQSCGVSLPLGSGCELSVGELVFEVVMALGISLLGSCLLNARGWSRLGAEPVPGSEGLGRAKLVP